MRVSNISEGCERAFNSQEHLIFGISPFNSYFSENKIKDMINWASKKFKKVQLYIPDEPTKYTLMAKGYDETKAAKKARRQCNYLKNKTIKALESNGLCISDISKHLITHTELNKNPVYLDKRRLVGHLFGTDEAFREGCLDSSRWVLSSHLNESEFNEKKLLIGVKYFLDELPMFLWGNEILGEKTSSFAYHQCPEFLAKLFREEVSGINSNANQGFSIIN